MTIRLMRSGSPRTVASTHYPWTSMRSLGSLGTQNATREMLDTC